MRARAKACVGTRVASGRAGQAVQPPSAVTTAPLTLIASSLPSQQISVEISAGLANRAVRPNDFWIRSYAQSTLGAAVRPMLVSTPPGHTALVRTPSGPYR